MVYPQYLRYLLTSCLFIFVHIVSADQVLIAAASNFTIPLQQLIKIYQQTSGDEIVASYASTGKLYAQIQNGAPFELFLAADMQRPKQLEKEGLIVENSRSTYAYGRLVLWSKNKDLIDDEGALINGNFNFLAMANARTAPYGLAARQVLEKLQLYNRLRSRIVSGENIGQTYQYVATGAADLGFIARSQISIPGRDAVGSHWLVPDSMHSPIEQQMVLLKNQPASKRFYTFISSDVARDIIRQYGYDLPMKQPSDTRTSLKMSRAQLRRGKNDRESGVYTTVCRFAAPHFEIIFLRQGWCACGKRRSSFL